MLRYLNRGMRGLGVWPIWAHRRTNWEFYAVLKGQCGVLFEPFGKRPLEDSPKLPLEESHLWVFPPQHHHGWYGIPHKPCEVAVFHFNRVPDVLEDAMRGQDFLGHALTKQNGRQLRAMVRSLEPDYQFPTQLGNLRADQVLIELTLMILADAPFAALATAEHKASEKVEAAMAWFRKHLRERPTLEDVAAAVHVSPRQLRRLFAEVREESPHDTMNEIQLETASRLLADSDEKLDFIATECGFSNSSNLCRAFKACRGYSPSQWRRRLPGYEQAFRIFSRADVSHRRIGRRER